MALLIIVLLGTTNERR
jgi:hypothetical protein